MTISFRAALVTGASRGLGAALVRALHAAGTPRIYAACRGDVAATDFPAGVIPLQLDVTRHAEIARAAQIAADVDLVINNAGVLPRGLPLEVPDTGHADALAVNLLGPLAVARAFTPVLVANGGGTLLQVLTLLCFRVEPHFAAYCASKWAAWAMTQALRAELDPRGVRVAAAFPGGIDTDMLAGVDAVKTPPASVAAQIVAQLRDGQREIFPDPTSQHFRDAQRATRP